MARIQHVSLENYRLGHFFPADVVIRIVDESPLFGSDRSAMETHHFVFGDLDENQPGPIQSSQADQIVTILKIAQEAQQNVLVHYVAGVSRSGAVAQFAVDFLGFEDANHQRNWRRASKWHSQIWLARARTLMCRVAEWQPMHHTKPKPSNC
jgi:protein-tyrosine phosphatase